MNVENNSNHYRLSVFQGKTGLEKIKPEWEHLIARLDRIRFCHLTKWYECYLDTLENQPEKVYFTILYENNKPAMIFPFKKAIRSFFGIKVNSLELPSYPPMPYYVMPLHDFILPKTNKSNMLFNIFLNKLHDFPELNWDVIYLPRIMEDSCAAYALSKSRFLLVRDPKTYCAYLTVESYENICHQLSSNFRANLKKAKNKLQKFGIVSFHSARTKPELEKAYKDFIDIEASGWKGKGGTAIKINKQIESFYHELCEKFSETEDCSIDSICINGKTIAAQFSITTEDTGYHFKTGYDENFASASPGNLLIDYCLKEYNNRSTIKYVNFVSNAPWLYRWNPEREILFNFYLHNTTIKGLITYLMTSSKYFARILYRATIKPYIKPQVKLIKTMMFRRKKISH